MTGTGIAITGILIALFGFINALAIAPQDQELQTLRYILTALGLILFALGIIADHIRQIGSLPAPSASGDGSRKGQNP